MNGDAAMSGVVCDGFGRWEAGVKAILRAKVKADFADRLRDASAFRSVLLRFEIEAEVDRRFRDVTPPSDEALF